MSRQTKRANTKNKLARINARAKYYAGFRGGDNQVHRKSAGK